MEAEALSQRSKSLQSLAAEGALLAQDAVSGKTSRIYTLEHSSELSKAASQAEASLKASKTEPVLEPKLRQLARVTGLIAGKLGILERYGVATHGSGGPGQAKVQGHPVIPWERVVHVGSEVVIRDEPTRARVTPPASGRTT